MSHQTRWQSTDHSLNAFVDDEDECDDDECVGLSDDPDDPFPCWECVRTADVDELEEAANYPSYGGDSL